MLGCFRAFFIFSLFFVKLFSLPSGLEVAFGEVFEKIDKNSLTISTGDRAILNWDSFSIKEIESLFFNMPSKTSTVLNRVIGVEESSILGRLEANGRLFLINPNGIFIGKNAVLKTDSFLASTLDILDQKFLEGGELKFFGDSEKRVVNLGKIEALGGDVTLIGLEVGNSGTIEAKNGKTSLVAAREVIFKPNDKENIFIRPSSGCKKEVGVSQEGDIRASKVELKADGNIYALAIKGGGRADALEVSKKGGEIFLEADRGRVEVTGEMVAKKEGSGGEVRVLGREVGILSKAKIDVRGKRGGRVLIGGDYRGKNENIKNAKGLFFSRDAEILADGLDGDGGRVILWSDDATRAYGSIFVRGGESLGDGGFVEISSKGFLEHIGIVDASSKAGKNGTFLLDPIDINITSTSPTGPDPFTTPTYAPTHTPTNLWVGDLTANLPTTDITVESTDGGTISLLTNITSTGNLTLKSRGGEVKFIDAKYTVSSGASVYSPQIITDNLLMYGETAECGIECQGSNSIVINVDTVLLRSTGANVFLKVEDGVMDINAAANVLLYSYGNFDAFIQTTGMAGSSGIDMKGTYTAAGLTLDATNSTGGKTFVSTDHSGYIQIEFPGNSYLKGGNVAGADASIKTGETSGGGNISIKSNDLEILGGTQASEVGVFSGYAGGSGDVTLELSGHLRITAPVATTGVKSSTGNIYLTANDIDMFSGNTDIFIYAPGGSISSTAGVGAIKLTTWGNGACYIECRDDMSLLGVDSISMIPAGAATFIQTSGSNKNLQINQSDSPGTGGITLNSDGHGFPAYIATNNGGNIDVYFSGDSSMRSATGVGGFSGIFSARTLGTGDIDFTSGNLTITGGSAVGAISAINAGGTGNVSFRVSNLTITSGSAGGTAGIFTQSAGGDILNSSTTSITINSGQVNGGIICPGGSITMNSVGPVTMSSNAAGGNAVISSLNEMTLNGVTSITMNPVSNDVYINTLDPNKNLSINSLPGSGGIFLNSGGSYSYSAYIATDKGGNIDIKFLGDSEFSAGNGTTSLAGIFTGYTSGNGEIFLRCGDLDINGGSGSGTALAGIYTGYASGSGTIYLTCGDLNLTGGSGTSGIANRYNAEIKAGSLGGNVNIVAGDMALYGGSDSNCSAYVRTIGAGNIVISSDSLLLSSSTTDSDAEAAIVTGSSSKGAYIDVGGDLRITANQAPAYIENAFDMDIGNDLIMDSSAASAEIKTANIANPTLDVGDDILMTGGSGNNIYTRITAPTATDITITVGEDFIMEGGTGTGTSSAYVSGYNNISITVEENLELRGSDISGSGFASIIATNGLSITSGRIELYGGDSSAGNAYAKLSSTNGNVTVRTDTGSLEVSGGNYSGADASIEALNGIIDLYIQGSIDMFSDGAASSSFIEADTFSRFHVNQDLYMRSHTFGNCYIRSNSVVPGGGALTVSAAGSIYLNQNAFIENQIDDLLMIAGNEVYIKNGSKIENKSSGDLTIVVDDDYPTPPTMGHGHFIFDGSSSIITSSGKVRIFTVSRDFDQVSGNINGSPYVPGPRFIDSNQEVWDAYYPDSFFGGPGFTIFYKNNETIKVVSLGTVAFAASELFYTLDDQMDDFYILDFYEKYIKRCKDYSYDSLSKYLEGLGEKNMRGLVYMIIR